VHYHNVESDGVRAQHAAIVQEIEERGLLFPVTVVDGVPVYDGAVSYPAIMRAVANRLLDREQAANA
jgi:hypothetical protein